MMKTPPENVFCGDAKCKAFWIDTKVEDMKVKVKEGEKRPLISPLMKLYDKWVGAGSHKGGIVDTHLLWQDIIVPHLENPEADREHLQIKNRDKDQTEAKNMVELVIYTQLVDTMTEIYDKATLQIKDAEGKILQESMYEGEVNTGHGTVNLPQVQVCWLVSLCVDVHLDGL